MMLSHSGSTCWLKRNEVNGAKSNRQRVINVNKLGDVFTTVGYFSKEKNPVIDYNLSCIMVLPAFMGKGYGKFCKSF